MYKSICLSVCACLPETLSRFVACLCTSTVGSWWKPLGAMAARHCHSWQRWWMVGHFVSDTHKVMTALIRVLLPSSVVVESLQSHKMWLCVNRDILLGLLKRVAAERKPELKVIITSATLDGQKFSEYFFNCPVVTVPGKLYPVQLLYSVERPVNYLDSSVQTALGEHVSSLEFVIICAESLYLCLAESGASIMCEKR